MTLGEYHGGPPTRRPTPAPNIEEPVLKSLAQAFMRSLCCHKCGNTGLIGDGKSSAGKHRFHCKSCRTSSNLAAYAAEFLAASRAADLGHVIP
jgi:tRNA(Ile2) C34 agmatinyltransferase TiaS